MIISFPITLRFFSGVEEQELEVEACDRFRDLEKAKAKSPLMILVGFLWIEKLKWIHPITTTRN